MCDKPFNPLSKLMVQIKEINWGRPDSISIHNWIQTLVDIFTMKVTSDKLKRAIEILFRYRKHQ